MAMFAKKFNKFIRMKKYGNTRRPQRREISKGELSKRENDPIVCYECKKLGHIKFECSLLKKQSKRPNKKAMVATQSHSDASDNDSYDDEVANLCLMALEDSKVTSIFCDYNAYSFDELQDAFEELAIDFKSMNMKYKKMIAKLNVENELLFRTKIDLEKNIDSMKVEINELTKKNTNLQNSFSRFYMGQQKLDGMLETQKAFFDKNGLGYDAIVKETHFKNFFAKSNNSHEALSTCAYCHRLGHSRQFCPLKVIAFRGKLVKNVWSPKGISTFQNEIAKKKWIPNETRIVRISIERPKKVWVPKEKN